MFERNELKGKRGLVRLRNAFFYSWDGLKAAYNDEEAFRQVLGEVVVGSVLAIWLGESWLESFILILPFFLSLQAEIINTALENIVDRISLEKHSLSKKAKDMGSALQFLCQIFIFVVWLSWLTKRFLF